MFMFWVIGICNFICNLIPNLNNSVKNNWIELDFYRMEKNGEPYTLCLRAENKIEIFLDFIAYKPKNSGFSFRR